jgi:hypothetical protein
MPKWVLSNDLQISWVGDHCRIFGSEQEFVEGTN